MNIKNEDILKIILEKIEVLEGLVSYTNEHQIFFNEISEIRNFINALIEENKK